ncbi:hypothetical protein BGZ79_009111 [Entomortierella chlamydospora]|nr:hypothetical protein BGZ79_009111 [Entomortierella chlamydospora]
MDIIVINVIQLPDDYDDSTQRKTVLVERRPTVDKDLQVEGESSLRRQHEGLRSVVYILGNARGKQPTELQEHWKNLRRRRRTIEGRENKLAEKLLENKARLHEILDGGAQELEDLHKRCMHELEDLCNRRVREFTAEKAEFKQEEAEFKQEKQASQTGEASIPNRRSKRPKQSVAIYCVKAHP